MLQGVSISLTHRIRLAYVHIIFSLRAPEFQGAFWKIEDLSLPDLFPQVHKPVPREAIYSSVRSRDGAFPSLDLHGTRLAVVFHFHKLSLTLKSESSVLSI